MVKHKIHEIFKGLIFKNNYVGILFNKPYLLTVLTNHGEMFSLSASL